MSDFDKLKWAIYIPDAEKSSKSAQIVRAMMREISSRRTALDASTDLSEVTVTVKFVAGTAKIRGVAYYEERVDRKHHSDINVTN